jgi:large subunit ribosomal protein L5
MDETMLKEKYKQEIVKGLMATGRFKNVMEVPRLEKVVVNMAVSSAAEKDALKYVAEDLARITGQKPILTKARKSVSNFKLRAGMPIGAKVTLRGDRMYDFLERLIGAALPRIRDFRGIAASFDGRGNLTFGLKEQMVFPEIQPDHVKKVQGMDITIVTTARSDADARELLKALGFPFVKDS